MSLYERIRGGDESIKKIEVWPLLNDLSLMLDGYTTMNDIVERHSLSAEEASELNTIFTASQSRGRGRLNDFHETWHTLIGIERGVLTESQALERFGVT